MTSHTPAEDDHLLDEDTLVPETQLESPGTFSQRIVTKLGIRSFIGNVDAATPNANPNLEITFMQICTYVCVYLSVSVCVCVCVCVCPAPRP